MTAPGPKAAQIAWLRKTRASRKAASASATRVELLRTMVEHVGGSKKAVPAKAAAGVPEPTAPAAAKPEEKTTMSKKPKTKKPAKPAVKKRSVSEAAANLRAGKAAAKKPKPIGKPAAERAAVPALEIAAFVCRDAGASMEELVKKFGIEAHPMRAKIHYVRHQLGYAVETKHGRYFGTAPKAA